MSSLYQIFIVLVWVLEHQVWCAPMLLEAEIHPKELFIKIMRPSLSLLDNLESSFDSSVDNLFNLDRLIRIPELRLAEIESNYSDWMTAVIASKNIDDSESFLMAPLAVPQSTLEKILTDRSGSFLQIFLPGHDTVGDPNSRVHNVTSNTSSAVMIVREPSKEEVINRFYKQFLKVDLDKDQLYIPQSVRNAMKNVQQVLIHPNAYFQTPEGQANADSQVYTITSATPVNVTMGLFEIVP